MSILRVVQFNNPLDFIEATQQYDDCFLNFTRGFLLDYIENIRARPQSDSEKPDVVLLAIYRENELLMSLTRHAKDRLWAVATPSHVDASCPKDSTDLRQGARLLVQSLFNMINPCLVDDVKGPEDAVNAFIEAWVAKMQTIGVRLTILEPLYRSRVCYATRKTLLPSLATSSQHQVLLASGPEDVVRLTPLCLAFLSDVPRPVTPKEACHSMQKAVEAGRAWICCSGEAVAGYIMVGRITPRTIAIRSVFVSPEHRCKGVAEAMVRTVTRYYLGLSLPEQEPNTIIVPREGIKEEVCLNVSDAVAMRVYQRCGFMLDNDARDPDTGRMGWYRSIWRGVKMSTASK
ncbi:uncharacterized protein FIBRA_00259 [Fibroporia radiculosa]|uniref:N-acetyltransferase domain-containing protein n=1 Tax=Fibroporia radiculosa TaxID=599839 RepID=J7RV93_9APHY|nr:uncharacterized protein FIBRA_00259 [Fibroporia radiculosa]CCL98265.1 predicted protein [Fibroporia radiculosa]